MANVSIKFNNKEFLLSCEDGQEVSAEEQSKFRSAVGKLLHMMRWSRPEIYNAVRECSRRMSKASPDHMKAVLRIMKYCAKTKDRGWEELDLQTINSTREFLSAERFDSGEGWKSRKRWRTNNGVRSV